MEYNSCIYLYQSYKSHNKENRHLCLNMILFSKTSSWTTKYTWGLYSSLCRELFFFVYNSSLRKNAIWLQIMCLFSLLLPKAAVNFCHRSQRIKPWRSAGSLIALLTTRCRQVPRRSYCTLQIMPFPWEPWNGFFLRCYIN